MADSSNLANVPFDAARWAEDRGRVARDACITSLVFMLISIGLRFWAQGMIGKLFSSDSWLILAATVTGVATIACTLVAIDHGLGKHTVRIFFLKKKKGLRESSVSAGRESC